MEELREAKPRWKVAANNQMNLLKGQDLLNIPLSKCLIGLLCNQRSSSKKIANKEAYLEPSQTFKMDFALQKQLTAKSR